jgi:hypothetical protein
MKHPAFQNLPRLLIFTGTCLLVGSAVAVSQSGLVSVSSSIIVLDGLISGLGFGILTLLLWYVIRFANLTGNDNFQKVVNYTALVILVNIVWLGSEYILIYVLFSDITFSAIVKSIPMKIIMGILIYTLTIRFLMNFSIDDEVQDEEPDDLKKPDSYKPEMDEAYANRVPKIGWSEKITVKVGQKIHVLAVADILFLQAEGDYVKIFTASSHFIKEQTMKYFEESLSPTKFVRIHRSFIVNIDAISRIELYEKQYYRITLNSGHQLKASASGYKLLKNTLQL